MGFIVAQITGLAGLIYTIVSNYQNRKDRVLIYQILANVLFFIQYFLLDALPAAITFLVGIIRCYVFYYYDKNKKKKSVPVLILFIVLILVLGILTYDDIFSLLPIIFAVLYAYGVWQDNLKVFRIIAFIVPVAWIVYNIHVLAYVGVLLSIVEALATLIAIIKLDLNKKVKELPCGNK